MPAACVATVFTVEKSTPDFFFPPLPSLLSFFSSFSLPSFFFLFFSPCAPPLYLHRRVTVFVKAPAEHRDNWRNYPGPPCEQSFPNGVFQIQRWIKCPFILAKPAPGKYTHTHTYIHVDIQGRGRRRGEKKGAKEDGGKKKEEVKRRNARPRIVSNSEFLSSLSCVSFRYLVDRISLYVVGRQPGRICWPLADFYRRALNLRDRKRKWARETGNFYGRIELSRTRPRVKRRDNQNLPSARLSERGLIVAWTLKVDLSRW